MEQVYWLSPAVAGGSTDERVLLYRYGSFVYTGPVITEPVRGLEYLPGVLAGIQAVQGQVPYLCEVKDLPHDAPSATTLLALQRALDLIHGELERHTGRLSELALADGGAWLDADDAALYFEFEAPAGYTCNVSGRGGGSGSRMSACGWSGAAVACVRWRGMSVWWCACGGEEVWRVGRARLARVWRALCDESVFAAASAAVAHAPLPSRCCFG